MYVTTIFEHEEASRCTYVLSSSKVQCVTVSIESDLLDETVAV